MIKSKSLVLFDIDGTLMRGAGDHHKAALMEGIRRVTSLSTNLEGVATSGMLDRDLISLMLEAAGHPKRRIRGALRQIMAECQNAYLSNCAPDLTHCVCTGIRDALIELKNRDAVLGLVTGNLSQIGWKKVELANLKNYFSVGGFAEDGRTRTRVARVAAGRAMKAGLVRRDCRISLIGDHPNDVKAAKANGFQAVAVATGLAPIEELQASSPDILVRDLSELNMDKLL